MPMNIKKKPLIFLLSTYLISGTIAAQEYYQWIDENGVTQFSQQPPDGHPDLEEKQLDTTPLTLPIQNQNDSQTAQTLTDNEQSDTVEQAFGLDSFGKDQEVCAQVLQSLQTMNEFENIVMTDPETGNGIFLSESERAAEQERLIGMRNYYCAN